MTPSKTEDDDKDCAWRHGRSPLFVDAQLYGLTTRSLNHNPRDYNKRDNSIKADNQAPMAAAIVAAIMIR